MHREGRCIVFGKWWWFCVAGAVNLHIVAHKDNQESLSNYRHLDLTTRLMKSESLGVEHRLPPNFKI